MRSLLISWMCLLFAAVSGPVWAQSRHWEDPSGQYEVTAKYVTSDDKLVVLEKDDGELVVLQRDQLSAEDQAYLAEQVAAKEGQPASAENPPIPSISTWRLLDGDVIKGELVGFGSQAMNVRRERGDLYVNQYKLDALPPAYEKILPSVVSAVDGKPIANLKDLEKHIADGGGGPFEYLVEGVQLKLDAGGAITIPLSLLASEDAKQIAPNFERWKAARAQEVSEEERYATDSRERLMLDSYQRLRTEEAVRQRQLKMMELGLLSVQAGIVSVWEVTLIPNHPYGYPRSVVVPARDSLTAQRLAQQRYPGWQLGAIRRLSR